ncbi:hypothetical protein [Lentzea sp. NPDC059081]|uniref:hypothetical protein n=1 Tax=Lentzea sp. NPDC059081 TaxID=3346719 RepID=UPI003690159F
MEVGDVAAWFAAGIAIIAAVIAMSNANSAKTQAGAALKQAAEAQKAREAAEAQVRVAEASVDQAKRSAEAAEASADEARKANDFEREKYERERADQDAKAITEAGRVRAHADLTGGVLWVFIANHASETILDLDVESVIATGGAWRWQIDEKVQLAPGYLQAISPGARVQLCMRLSDGYSMVGDSWSFAKYDIAFSFTDSNGQRWRRVNDGAPERVV